MVTDWYVKDTPLVLPTKGQLENINHLMKDDYNVGREAPLRQVWVAVFVEKIIKSACAVQQKLLRGLLNTCVPTESSESARGRCPGCIFCAIAS